MLLQEIAPLSHPKKTMYGMGAGRGLGRRSHAWALRLCRVVGLGASLKGLGPEGVGASTALVSRPTPPCPPAQCPSAFALGGDVPAPGSGSGRPRPGPLVPRPLARGPPAADTQRSAPCRLVTRDKDYVATCLLLCNFGQGVWCFPVPPRLRCTTGAVHVVPERYAEWGGNEQR